MPHFIRKNRGLVRKKLSNDEILDLINERINFPGKYYNDAKTFQNLEPLRKILEGLENQAPLFKPPKNGILTGRNLRNWFYDAVQAKILHSEHHRIAKALKVRKQLSQAKIQ